MSTHLIGLAGWTETASAAVSVVSMVELAVVVLAALTTAVVALAVLVLAAAVPAVSGRCPVPASDAAPQRQASVIKSPTQGRGRSSTCRPGCRQSGIGQCHRLLVLSPWLRRSPVAAQLSRGPAAMRRDLLGGVVVLAESSNSGVPQIYCNFAIMHLHCIS